MKKIIIIAILLVAFNSFAQQANEKKQINTVLNNWHKAAANADFKTYFSLMTHDGVFVGTDPTENWQNDAFKEFAKPYFDAGKAWSFTAIQRNIYLSEDKKIAWFDELLKTQMEICRGSGVLKLVNGKWKITHYVLSITIPNDQVNEVVAKKKQFDEQLMKQLEAE
ncbi:nuclear transport factor 2 family protein [Zhouia sp. PK063]|uniref:nuclear transport factor 2 family protein n=1 Tax=Zhouia sp. PK063 TaxID=3373602 RepID=UPI003790A7DF